MSGPPPPYDSVVAGDHHPFFSGANFTGSPTGGATGGPSRAFDIAVVDPIKQGEGMGAHVCYKVRTKTTQPGYARPVNEVRRRFRDFSVLADVLAERYKGAILPPLPDKSTVQKFQMGPEFIETRRKALQVFIIKVASHPLLQGSRELQTFLEASDDEWLLASAGWTAEVAAASKPTVNNAVAWFKSLQHSAQSLVSGRSDDSLEDQEYLKVRDYINALEGHLSEAHRQAARLVRKEAELGAALAEFGLAAEQLGKYDEGGLRPALDALGGRATSIATLSRQRSEALTAEFEAPLKEFARGIKSVQAAMADRAVALAAFGQAKSDLEGKKVRLAKMRATPGLKEDKISEAERDVTDAEQKLRNAKIGYEGIVSRMTEELNRFQKERAAEMTTVLKQFALAQAQASAEQAQAWGQFLEELQQQQAAVAAVPPQGGAVAASG